MTLEELEKAGDKSPEYWCEGLAGKIAALARSMERSVPALADILRDIELLEKTGEVHAILALQPADGEECSENRTPLRRAHERLDDLAEGVRQVQARLRKSEATLSGVERARRLAVALDAVRSE